MAAVLKETEASIQRTIMDYLTVRRIFHWRQNSGAFPGEYKGKKRFVRFTSIKGVSDILGIYKGRLLAIEVKRPGEKPTVDQLAFMESVKAAGGIAFVARDLGDVIHGLCVADEL